MTDSHGVDVSHYNVISNYDLARASLDWVYLKATEGSTLVDNYFWDSVRNEPGDHYRGFGGLPRGAYHFTDLGNIPTEVAHFVSFWQKCPTENDPMLDAECSGINSSYIKGWIDEFRKQTGHERIWVYSSKSLFEGACDPSGFADSNTPLWAARYRKLNTPYNNGNQADGWNLGWDHPMLGCYQWDDAQPLSGGSLVDADVARIPMVVSPTPVPTPPSPSPSPVPPSPSPVIPRGTYLRLGSKGQYVKDLQERLNRDYPLYSHLVVDGDFGPRTERVVEEFQSRSHIHVDGIAGPVTLHKLGLQ